MSAVRTTYYANNFWGIFKASGRKHYFIRLVILAIVSILIFSHIFTSYVSEGTYQRLKETLQPSSALLASIRAKPVSMDDIHYGLVFNITPNAEWRTPFPKDGKPFGSSIPPNNERTKVYTYLDDDERGTTDLEDDWKNKNLIIAWQRAIYAAGFHPVILDPSNAEAHPKFADYKKRNVTIAEKLAAKKYFALAFKEGQILWDFHLVPTKNRYEDSFIESLINNTFGKPTGFKEYGNRFLHTNLTQLNLALDDLSKLGGISLSQFEDNIIKTDLPSDNLIADYSKENVAKILKFPGPSSVTTENIIHLISIHMHQKFISRYSKGLLVLEPSLEHSSILTAPSKQLVERLSVCPKQPSCPPTKAVLDELDRIQKLQKESYRNEHKEEANQLEQSKEAEEKTIGLQAREEINFDPYKFCVPCTENIPILTSRALEDTHKVFTIGMVPHPLTLLAIQEGSPHLTAGMIHSRREKDIWIKPITSSYIANKDYGSANRLLLLKDTMVNDPFVSNISWYNWEQYWSSDKLNSEEPIEWQFGFELPDVIANLEVSVPNSADNSEFSDIHLAKTLVEVKNYINSGKHDGLMSAIEIASPADVEIWTFLNELQKYENNALRSLAN
ncbi:hypothetical protein NADFUDRAFT_50818 [Nadsonia fulvescens var. elongata DSM 6958]|uniref:Uncharacterized protein n=1 Tax=Nadsonia fulvescens var. elongata DSM 6958 TaxID=857566 RepID=A0A1E3PJE6_9ASCO|nr:hypothetical protein NADFUDRAFT_50818 [Nadsonia fulvescens var. elongata DSM 6958]